MAPKRSRAVVLLLALMAMLAIAVGGCGDDDDDGGDGGGSTEAASGGGEGSPEAAAEQVQALLDPADQEFEKPTEAFDPGRQRVSIISCGNAGINCLNSAEAAVTAAETMGWETSGVLDGQFNPATQSGFIRQAIQEDYDAIVLTSIDANSIKAAVDDAAAAGIPISCVMCLNPGFEGTVTDVTTGGANEGDAIGYYLAAQGDTKVAFWDDPSFPIVAARNAAAKETMEANCPDCEVVDELSIPTTELTEPGPPSWTAFLAANPAGSVTASSGPYDPFTIPFVKSAKQQGRDDIAITGYDASSEMVDLIAEGEPAAATTAVPFIYASWGAVDQVARVLADVPEWESNSLPAILVTQENSDLESLGEGFFDPPFDYEAEFKELWGVN